MPYSQGPATEHRTVSVGPSASSTTSIPSSFPACLHLTQSHSDGVPVLTSHGFLSCNNQCHGLRPTHTASHCASTSPRPPGSRLPETDLDAGGTVSPGSGPHITRTLPCPKLWLPEQAGGPAKGWALTCQAPPGAGYKYTTWTFPGPCPRWMRMDVTTFLSAVSLVAAHLFSEGRY